MASKRPIRKVTAGGLGGLGATVLVAVVDYAGAGLPQSLAALLAATAATVAAYATPSAPAEPTQVIAT